MNKLTEKFNKIDKDDRVARKYGERFAKLLNLKKNKERDLYETDYGFKTEIGLARSIASIIEDNDYTK